jgi:hypothetical protein
MLGILHLQLDYNLRVLENVCVWDVEPNIVAFQCLDIIVKQTFTTLLRDATGSIKDDYEWQLEPVLYSTRSS